MAISPIMLKTILTMRSTFQSKKRLTYGIGPNKELLQASKIKAHVVHVGLSAQLEISKVYIF
jgi:hypothetical protein